MAPAQSRRDAVLFPDGTPRRLLQKLKHRVFVQNRRTSAARKCAATSRMLFFSSLLASAAMFTVAGDRSGPTPDCIVLSPHLDDAALSCGGGIAAATAGGRTCLVVTVCAGIPPAGFPFDAGARDLHRRWGLSDADAVQRRRDEDATALTVLAADGRWLDVLDGQYRRSDPRRPLRVRWHQRWQRLGRALGRTPRPAREPGIVTAMVAALRPLAQQWPHADWWVPLGVGGHGDHRAVHDAALALRLPQLRCYEDYPYVAVPGALAARLAEIGPGWRPELLPIATTLDRKIVAIAAYTSQVPSLFAGGATDMPAAVAAYAAGLDPARGACERLWRPY